MIRDPIRQAALLDDIRAFVRDIAIPAEAQVEADDAIPEPIVAQMRARGYFGLSIPAEYGGAGLTVEELILAAFELSQAATAFRARVGTNTGIGAEGLIQDGTAAQKARYLPSLASGEMTGCLALTEAAAGSDATAIETTATRDGDCYLLSGEKRFITNAPIADLFTVLARTSDQPGTAGLSAFLVERGMPGVFPGAPYRKMGQAGSPVSEVAFRACRVPAANLLGGREGQGFRTVMKVLNKQRIHLAALCTGAATRMQREAVAHATRRRQFGRPIADFQLVQAMIADNATEIAAARALVLQAARSLDDGDDIRQLASMCKYFASEACGRVADRAVQIFGGAGYVADYACIERLYRDARLFRLYEGTSQIHQISIARHVLGEA